MTPDEINIAIAESVGWHDGGGKSNWFSGFGFRPGLVAPGGDVGYLEPEQVPDYYHDLNEIHEVVRGLTDYQFEDYVPHLRRITDAMIDCYADDLYIEGTLADYRVMHQATAAQHCEAYLRTIGKWKEADAQAGH